MEVKGKRSRDKPDKAPGTDVTLENYGNSHNYQWLNDSLGLA